MSDERIPNTSVVAGNVVDDPIAMMRSLERDLERAQAEIEFWYSFARELVALQVQRRGTDRARYYVEKACEGARRDFPRRPLANDASLHLMEQPRRLSQMYAAWGSFQARAEGLAKGEEREDGG